MKHKMKWNSNFTKCINILKLRDKIYVANFLTLSLRIKIYDKYQHFSKEKTIKKKKNV